MPYRLKRAEGKTIVEIAEITDPPSQQCIDYCRRSVRRHFPFPTVPFPYVLGKWEMGIRERVNSRDFVSLFHFPMF